MAAAGQDLDALTRAAQQRGFRAVPLGLTASVTLDNQIRRFASRNVIGVLPGRTRPNEYVHLHRPLGPSRPLHARPARTESATARSTMPAAPPPWSHSPRRTPAPARADRTIIFLAVTAEESGLLGSAYYAANPIYPLARTAGGFNMDSLNMAGAGARLRLDRRRQVGARRLSRPRRRGRQASRLGRADARGRLLFPLRPVQPRQAGVPMLYGRGGEDLVNGGPAAGPRGGAGLSRQSLSRRRRRI